MLKRFFPALATVGVAAVILVTVVPATASDVQDQINEKLTRLLEQHQQHLQQHDSRIADLERRVSALEQQRSSPGDVVSPATRVPATYGNPADAATPRQKALEASYTKAHNEAMYQKALDQLREHDQRRAQYQQDYQQSAASRPSTSADSSRARSYTACCTPSRSSALNGWSRETCVCPDCGRVHEPAYDPQYQLRTSARYTYISEPYSTVRTSGGQPSYRADAAYADRPRIVVVVNP